MGTGLPPGVEPFLRRIHNMEEAEIYEHYQMSHRTHARVLKTRVADLLDGGFERAVIAGYGRMTPGDGVKYGNEFFYGLQPPCCAVKDEHCEIRGVKESKLRGLDAGALEVWPGNEPGRRRARSGRDRRRRRISYARRTGGRPDACWREGRGWWVDGTVRIASEASRCAREGGCPRESREESSFQRSLSEIS